MTPGEPLVRWDWIASHAGEIATRIGEHLILTGIAVAVGLAIALPVGLAVARRERLYAGAVWASGVLYTIPSLALFALLIPFSGLSVLTAEIGLVSYTLLILVRNVVVGIRSVPEEVRDAARGMGYAPRQVLWGVELPIALPVIVAGLRVATVSTIGLVTVTALIGQGGLGAFILDGIQRFFSTPLILGAVLSVLLAVVIDSALAVVERALTPWREPERALARIGAT
ncbi:MAG TPA: ABC transporter permease [Candidatus Limnocylindria bacterium]|nr:ABC transporter permease [Candidatus Limnocylindria bacterium]